MKGGEGQGKTSSPPNCLFTNSTLLNSLEEQCTGLDSGSTYPEYRYTQYYCRKDACHCTNMSRPDPWIRRQSFTAKILLVASVVELACRKGSTHHNR
eukprot:4592815-Ditylum_brightwellii.AAC.1